MLAPPSHAVTPESLHDLRNQLQVLLVTAAAVAEDLTPGDPHYEDLQVVLASARRALTLAQSRSLPIAGPVPLEVLLTGWRAGFERVVGPGIALRLEVEPGLPRVVVDPRRLEDALLNLLLNAVQAMPSGGAVMVRAGAVDRALSPGGGWVRVVALTVADVGAGMPPEVLARCREPHFTTRAGGSGLGLASVSRFVQEAGGAIEVDSAPGEGTTVTLLLSPAPGPSRLPVPPPAR